MKLKNIFIILGVIASITIVVIFIDVPKEKSMPTFVITETAKYNSLDPLDGDNSQNLPVARMVYSTPIEINADNTLGSRVLETFSYDRSSKTIQWIVRSGITYSDGSTITPEDIAFAVTRMAFTRPQFPLIKLIHGLEPWLKMPSPLKSYPEGIKVIGNKITIELTEDYPHPLFRFCLELFSIIPKKFVNLETNKIIEGSIPTSGYYEIKTSEEKSIVFQQRPGIETIHGKSYPKQIKFLYRDPIEAFKDSKLVSDDTVILSSESLLTRDQIHEIESEFQVNFTPASWFTLMQINPDVTPFQDPVCRLAFAEAFRRNYEKLSSDTSEASVFTKIVSGYKTHKDLLDSASLKLENRIACLTKLSQAKIPVGFYSNTPKIFIDTIIATATELGIELIGPTNYSDRKQEVSEFLNGNSTFLYNRTGFWAMDPTGDIQMLFTPNLHKVLRHYWNDDHLQSLLHNIVRDGVVNLASVDSINSYLFANAKFNVYSHIRRFYASRNKDLVKSLPIGITNPSPWQLFGGH